MPYPSIYVGHNTGGRIVDYFRDTGLSKPTDQFGITTSLFNHNRELSEISQKAYFSILNGENIASVRFAYDRATDEYWKNHMWDD